MSESLSKDINAAVDLVNGRMSDPCGFHKYAAPFLFGTENQEGINSVIDYKDKDIVTIASSGDQYLGAVYYGGKNIDIFDINRMTYYVTCLKIAAIMVLDYVEFLDFFTPYDMFGMEKKSFWNLKTLKKLLSRMPSDVAFFWDVVMYEAQKNDFGDLVLLQEDGYALHNIRKGMPFYQSEEEYYRLQKLLRSRDFPKFFETDILNLKDVLTSTYDIAYLSNVLECLVAYECDKEYYPFMPSFFYMEQEDRNEKKMAKSVIAAVKPLLNKNGTILLSYRSNVRNNQSDWLYSNDYFDVNEVPAKHPPKDDGWRTENTDLVLTYKPKRQFFRK